MVLCSGCKDRWQRGQDHEGGTLVEEDQGPCPFPAGAAPGTDEAARSLYFRDLSVCLVSNNPAALSLISYVALGIWPEGCVTMKLGQMGSFQSRA